MYHLVLHIITSSVPSALSLNNGCTITNPYNLVNTFNKYFASIAETTKKCRTKTFFGLSMLHLFHAIYIMLHLC